MTESVPAVITAGGRISGEFAASAGTTVKALAGIEGIPMVERVLGALHNSGRVQDPVIIVGPEAEVRNALAVQELQKPRFVPEGETGPENMMRGLAAIPESAQNHWAVLCTCDLPFLSGEAVRWLLNNAPKDADIVFPILTKAEYEAGFPGSPGTYVGVEGEPYTGGSVFLVRPVAFSRNRALIERVFAARKSVLAMARLGGFGLLRRLAFGGLTIKYVEERASQLTGCRCRAVCHAPPSLAADVDTLEDYRYACEQLAARGTRV